MHSKSASFLIIMLDALAFLLAFIASGFLARYIYVGISGGSYMELISLESLERAYRFLFLAALAMFSFYNKGHYTSRIPFWGQLRYMAIVIFTMLIVDGFIQFAFNNDFSRLWISMSWILSFLFLMVTRQIARIVGQKIQIWNISTVIIGDGSNIVETAFAIYSEGYTGYEITDIILQKGGSLDKNSLPASYKNVNIIKETDANDSFIRNNKNNFYVIAPNSFSSSNIEKLVKIINENKSSYAIVPPIEGVQLYGAVPQYFFQHDIMFLFPRNAIGSPFGSFVKRSIDIIGSSLAILTFAPLFVIIAIMIKSDGGHVFYGQGRIGRGNKKFKCLKFRSMAVDAEERLQAVLDGDPSARKIWDTHRKLTNDPRITKVGSLLRKSSFDELPQLLNVLKGDMSLVGPRPIIPDETEFFDKKEFANYASVRPGITGLWQVSGRNDVSFKQRVHFDNWYVENWSLWCDIVIVIKTVGVIVRRVGAY